MIDDGSSSFSAGYYRSIDEESPRGNYAKMMKRFNGLRDL